MGSEIGMKHETRSRDDELAAKRLRRLKREGMRTGRPRNTHEVGHTVKRRW